MNLDKLILRNFRNYILKNLTMVFLLCLVIIPICAIYYNGQSDAVINAQRSALDNSTELLNSQLASVNSMLEGTLFSSKIQLFSTMTALKPDNYLSLKEFQNTVASICNSNNYLLDVIVSFENCDTVVNRHGCFTPLAKMSGMDSFLHYYTFSDAQFISYLKNPSSQTQMLFCRNGLDVDSYTWPQTQHVSFVYGKNIGYTSSRIYVYLLVQHEGLENLYSTVDGRVVLYGYNNLPVTYLFTEKPFTPNLSDEFTLASDEYTLIHSVMELDMENYQLILHSTALTILFFSLIVLILSIILSIASAYASCKPLKKLVSTLQDLNPDVQNYKETFSYLLGSMRLLQEKQKSITSQLEISQESLVQNYIDRCLRTSVSVFTDVASLPKIPEFPLRYVVGYAVVRCVNGALDESNQALLTKMIGNRLSDETKSLMHQLDNASFVLIIPSDSDDDRQIALLEKNIEELSLNTGVSICFAVSPLSEGISRLNYAFECARSIMSAHRNIPGIYLSGEKTASSDPPRFDNRRLYDAVLEANYPLSSMIIEELMSDSFAYLALEERFSFACMLMQMALHQISPDEHYAAPSYSCYLPPEKLVQSLNEFALKVCHLAAQHIDGVADIEEQAAVQESTDRIISYIKEFFTTDTLSIQSICSDCQVSEKTLNEICRKETGMNVSVFIRQLRMDKASSMLRNTDVKVIDVLKECGYNTPNAFYKAFKQMYGKSPSEYRALFR